MTGDTRQKELFYFQTLPSTSVDFFNNLFDLNLEISNLEINPIDVTAFSTNKTIRLIGVDKNLYLLTLKSWKETKKELSKLGILQKLDLSKAS